mmetsp:Transcript_378/g.798  ORF Transcript_378/g.798 Transcript_378/m.798 type:complete len:81 (-) Transcript_378:181-423(-)
MGVPVIQGYGMTENFAAAIIQPFHFTRVGSIGAPIPCTEVKLQDTDYYKCTDRYPSTAQEFEQRFSHLPADPDSPKRVEG